MEVGCEAADGVFAGLPQGHFKAILADPPWSFRLWRKDTGNGRLAESHYSTMAMDEIAALPVADLAADSCVLFMWACWPSLPDALRIIEAWGFQYKTCGFDWMKAHSGQIEMFRDDGDVQVGMGYWTRANTEPCLLATRGKPKRVNADVRQGIIEPRRQHSRKPGCVYDRIERLVEGPYLELFSRTTRPGWTVWGNQVGKFEAAA